MDSSDAGGAKASKWDDPRISNALMTATLSYAVYLALAGVFVALRARTRGFDTGIVIRLGFWVLQVGFLFYLSIAAAASKNLI